MGASADRVSRIAFRGTRTGSGTRSTAAWTGGSPCGWAAAAVRGAGDARDQLRRAAASVPLNIAEGCGKQGRERARYLSIARGRVLEVAAALDVLWALRAIGAKQHAGARALCERVYAMLTAMLRGLGALPT